MKNPLDWLASKAFYWSLNRLKHDEKRKAEILSLAVQRLFNAIGVDDILREDSHGIIHFKGKALTELEMNQLKEEAKLMQGFKLWHVLRYDIKYQINKKMFEEVKVPLDVVWGQLILFLEDVIRARFKRLIK